MNVKQVAEGIEWARKSWPMGEYLSVSHIPACYPFDPTDFFDVDREELRSFLESELLQHPGDIAVRFTSIFIPFACSHCYLDHEVPDPIDSHEGHLRNEFRKLLAHFVGVLRIEECTDWERTRWEILNCYAGQNWDLARELYNRAEQLQLPSRDDLLFLRAQFDFFLVFGRQMTADVIKPRESGPDPINDLNLALDSLLWPPILLSELIKDYRSARLWLVLLEWCLNLDGHNLIKKKEDLELIIDAIRGFSLGINNRAELKSLYAPLLARSYFAKGEFTTAAELYGYVANVVEKGEGEVASIRRLSLEAVAKCYEMAALLQEAVNALDECAREFPSQRGLHTRMAMLFARMGNFEQVADCLRAEQQRNPEVGEDWKDSTILALGSIGSSGMAEDRIASIFYQMRPELAKGIEGVVSGLWPDFNRLSPEARQYWAFGAYQANFHSEEQQGFWQNKTDAAVASFAKAVEWELKTRLFNKWRDAVRPNILASAAKGGDETLILLKFVRNSNPKITLGQMFESLKRSDKSNDPLAFSLRSWTIKNCPDLLKGTILNAGGDLARLSGDAKHGSIQQGDELRAQELGRKVLETIAKCS
jgi:hypothetical protein